MTVAFMTLLKFETSQSTFHKMSASEEDTEYLVVRAPLSPVVEMPPEYPDDEESTTLLPCAICTRTFTASALQRHSKVCEKLQAKKRNNGVSLRQKFDSTKQRQEGIDIPPLGLKSRENKEEKTKSRWREKHQEFLRTIRAAKGDPDESGDNGDGESRRNIPSDYLKCPHCDRHFGPKAADRHINWCGEQKSRLPRTHTSEDAEAIHRLKTRTKYTPPKPGQNGWRAPKKRDVISSIPPANAGPNITPPGRLISPPPPVHRQISPPPIARPHNAQRHLSPPPMSPSRKGSSSSNLPPGPHRYSTASLGRSVGRQFSSMLQSVTGCSPGYGISTGYGSPSLYGSSPNQGHMAFSRSASLKLPRRRSGTQGRMARHRDLASDMLASVTLGGKAKREEPEGDEASNMTPFYDRSPPKLDNAPYDPFSAAELQFQDLLGPAKPGGGLRSDLMGSTSSLKQIGGQRRFSPERYIFPVQSKPRSSSLMGGGSISLCSLGLDSFDFNRSPGADDSSELESLENSPRDLRSPDDGMDDVVSRFSTSSRVIGPFSSETSNLSYKHGGSRLSESESQYRHSRSPSLSSQSARSVIQESSKRKHPEGGSTSWQKFPSPFSFRFDSSERKSPVKERSPSLQIARRPSPGLKKHESDIENSNVNSYSGWTNHSDLSGSPKTYSRYFGGRSQRDSSSEVYSQTYSSAFESIKALRASLGDEKKPPTESLEEKHQRVSSSSSTDSSLPALASPPLSASPIRREEKAQTPVQSSLPTFCYECGNKYPVVVARFCCHCGARRLVIAE